MELLGEGRTRMQEGQRGWSDPGKRQDREGEILTRSNCNAMSERNDEFAGVDKTNKTSAIG